MEFYEGDLVAVNTKDAPAYEDVHSLVHGSIGTVILDTDHDDGMMGRIGVDWVPGSFTRHGRAHNLEGNIDSMTGWYVDPENLVMLKRGDDCDTRTR